MTHAYLSLAYLLSSILFIFSIRGLASPETARRGNLLGMLGMALAVSVTMYSPLVSDYKWVLLVICLGGIIGTWSALKVKMTAAAEPAFGTRCHCGLRYVYPERQSSAFLYFGSPGNHPRFSACSADWRRRHAGCHFRTECLFRMGGCRHRLLAQ